MAPWQHDLSAATIGAALAILGLGWLVCSIPFAVLVGRALSRGPYIDAEWDDFDDHCATTPGLDVPTLPVEEAAFEVLRPRVLAAAEAITKEAAS